MIDIHAVGDILMKFLIIFVRWDKTKQANYLTVERNNLTFYPLIV
jgi:hypothetical protein